MNTLDTIAALSSPPGRSPRGLLRIAGPNASPITQQLLAPRVARGLVRGISQQRLADPNLPVLLATFPAPKSYTGDDTAELQLPGHPALLERVLHQAFALGARPAEPGEFTYRAWKNGKLDFLQAEGIAALIAARSDAQLAAAHQLKNRKLGQTANQLAATLADLLALVEAGIDFTDQEDVVPIAPAVLHQRLTQLAQLLQQLLDQARSFAALDSLPRVVLAGPPSAGKSTLFNALLNQPRAVTDETQHTTRDAIEEPCQLLPGLDILLVDLAGLDAQLTHSAGLDHAAQQAAHHAIQHADVVLELLPPNQPHATLRLKTNQPHLRVQTKCDLDPTHPRNPRTHPRLTPNPIQISAHTGQNLDQLRHALAEQLQQLQTTTDAESLALQPRHADALRAAHTALAEALQHLDPDAPSLALPELIATHLRDALDQLTTLADHIPPDDVIGRVFAGFCVGK